MSKLAKASTINSLTRVRMGGSMRMLLVIALCLTCGPVGAQTVNISSCPVETSANCVIGIDGLDILGATYNMTVFNGTFDNLFGDPASQLTSWDNQAWALSARDAIRDALNNLVPIPTRPTTKFSDGGADDRHESMLHLPQEYQEYSGDPMAAFNGPCVEIREAPSVLSTNCGTWLSNRRLAFALFASVAPNPDTLLEQLGAAVIGVGPGNSFANKMALAQAYFSVLDIQATCDVLTDLVNQIQAQKGKKITLALGDQLTAEAQAIMAAIACN